MSRGNINIIKGMDAIINPDNIKPGMSSFDLKQLEKSMIAGGLIQNPVKDPQDKYNDELAAAAKKLGIDFSDISKKAATPASTPPPIAQASTSQKPTAYITPQPLPFRQSTPTVLAEETPEEDDEEEEEEDDEEEDDEEEDDDAITTQLGGTSPSQSSNTGTGDFGSYPKPAMVGTTVMTGGSLSSRTHEQQMRSHIDNVIGSTDAANAFSLEAEKKEDLKWAMLSEIDNLRTSLMEENVDLSRIPEVNRMSDYGEVEAAFKILRHKNDHIRCCSFAEEALLFGAYALEELFDGKRSYLGRYKPDLTGYHNQMNVKLRRLRSDTGQIVSAIMQDYNIGPGWRILLELLPNMVLYSKMRSSQYNEPDLFTDDAMQASNNHLRDAM